jgi:hypothetical protein
MSARPAGPQTPPEDDLVARLSRVRGIRHLDDERRNREEILAGQGHPVYPGPPVPLPRWLWGGKKKRSG